MADRTLRFGRGRCKRHWLVTHLIGLAWVGWRAAERQGEEEPLHGTVAAKQSNKWGAPLFAGPAERSEPSEVLYGLPSALKTVAPR